MEPRDLFSPFEPPADEIASLLEGCGFSDARRADEMLLSISMTVSDPARMEVFGPALLAEASEAADPDAMLLRFDDLLRAMASPINLLEFLLDNRQALNWLLRILGASTFASQTLLRNPEYVYWLLDLQRLPSTRTPADLRRIAGEAIKPFGDSMNALDALRRMRRREMLRLAAQDILSLGDVTQIVSQVSHLADAILAAAYDVVRSDFSAPQPEFAVLALGKLGGEELNFSSDVDLIYAYADEQDQERVLNMAKLYTRAVSEASSEGRLYRVDLRLRPMGRGGAIAYSLGAFRHYHETWADTADRLALIKCRAVAGDTCTGAEFSRLCEAFVYRRYVDLAAVEEVRWLKHRTDLKMSRRGESRRNIKLGLGGIREIEFFVQAFQLLYGSRTPDVRTPNTLEALNRLVDRGFVPLGDFEKLRDAYVFFRSLEHKLQLVEDRQTHTLPTEKGRLQHTARLMSDALGSEDPASADHLQKAIDRQRKNVRDIFEGLFQEQRLAEGPEELVLNPELRGKSAVAWLQEKSVPHPEKVWRGLEILLDAPAYPHSPSRIRNLLANLVPRLLRTGSLLPDPSLLFSRLDRVCEAVGSRASLYQALVENREFSERLLRVLSSGDFLTDALVANPELLDSLQRLPDARTRRQLEQDLKGLEPSQLPNYKRKAEFKIALETLFDPAAGRRSRISLSELAEACLIASIERAVPLDPALEGGSFVVIGLGKLGGRELTFHSDLDLMLIFDDENVDASIDSYTKVVKVLRQDIEEFRKTGRAYRLDFRLRPEGRRGPLATPLSALNRYFVDRIEPWERLAYVKARAIWNPAGLDPLKALWSRPLGSEEVAALRRVRARMEVELAREEEKGVHDFKVGPGGLADIQFLVQCLQLQGGIREAGTSEAMGRLEESGMLSGQDRAVLVESLDFLYRLESAQRLLSERATTSLPRVPETCALIADFMGLPDGGALLANLAEVRRRVREVFELRFPDGS